MRKRIYHLLILVGLVLTMGFQQAADAIATVGGDPIPVALFQQRVRFARWNTAQQLLQIAETYGANSLTDPKSAFYPQYLALSDTQAFANQVLDSLINAKLVKHEAAARGITITEADTQEQITSFFGFAPGGEPVAPAADQTAVPTLSPADMTQIRDDYFGQAGAVSQMGQIDVIAIFADQALEIKLYRALTNDVPKQGEQIKTRQILVDSPDKANALLSQMTGGASFADLATTNSQDPISAPHGGDLGWTPRGVYVAEFDTAIWNATLGSVVGPVKTPFGYHLILIEGRETRPFSEADLIRERDVMYRQWLQQARAKGNVQIVENWQASIPQDPTLQALGLPVIK